MLTPKLLYCVTPTSSTAQWGQRAKCATMAPAQANGLQTWWHALLMGDGSAGVNETVAIATGALASGW